MTTTRRSLFSLLLAPVVAPLAKLWPAAALPARGPWYSLVDELPRGRSFEYVTCDDIETGKALLAQWWQDRLDSQFSSLALDGAENGPVSVTRSSRPRST